MGSWQLMATTTVGRGEEEGLVELGGCEVDDEGRLEEIGEGEVDFAWVRVIFSPKGDRPTAREVF